ncbi:MAG: hypothetical protein LUG66_10300 [Clostridiales bacterium]|nr:hypothetical protein [Clostridiales bacterium]
MEEKIIERLKSLGWEYDSEADGAILTFEAERGEAYMLSACNLSVLPAVLEGVYIDYVCGSFLRAKLYGGLLSDETAEGIIAKITEGDVTVEYAADKELSTAERLELILKGFLGAENEIIASRRLKW